MGKRDKFQFQEAKVLNRSRRLNALTCEKIMVIELQYDDFVSLLGDATHIMYLGSCYGTKI